MILLNIVLLAMVVFNFWYIFKLNAVFEKFVNEGSSYEEK